MNNDKQQIIELTARYALAMDEHNVDQWLTTWSEDGKWEGALGTYIGKAKLPQLLKDLGERIENRRHVITNHVIDVSDQEATQTCYMQILAYKGGCRIAGMAVYRDRLRKVDGQWRFFHRQMSLDT